MHHRAHNNMHHKAYELALLPEDLVAAEGVARKAPFLYASQGSQIICITQAQNMFSQGAPLQHKAPIIYATQGT